MNVSKGHKITPELRVSADERGTCRVCLDSSAEHLITPCKCDGTLKYIHESCLKCWITAKRQTLDASCCEICQTPFVMSVKYSTVLKCGGSSPDLRPHCRLASALTFAFLVFLTFVGYTVNLVIHSDSDEILAWLYAILVVVLLASFSILCIIVGLYKKLCFHVELAHWTIHNRTVDEAPEGSRPSNLNQENV